MANYRILISSSNIPERVAVPIWKPIFTYTREGVGYAVELKEDMIFKGDDYEKLLILERQRS